jgi:DNA-binding FadR family transcriptional regulator
MTRCRTALYHIWNFPPRNGLSVDRPAGTVAEHGSIYEAIADRDGAAARRAMRRHLNAVLHEFSRGLDDRRRTLQRRKAAS